MSKKTIWITGASSGIGKATAIKFADEGWKVLISARRAELLNELSKNENIFTDYFQCGPEGINNPKSSLEIATNELIKVLKKD